MITMRKALLIIVAIISSNCAGQNKSVLELQQIEFKDILLTNKLVELTKSAPACFQTNEFYTLDFFQSSLTNDEYYLSIDVFINDSLIPNSVSYYTVINNITFFISSKVSSNIYRVLPIGKKFVFKQNDIPYYVGGDYHFLIWKTLSGSYHVLFRTCSE